MHSGTRSLRTHPAGFFGGIVQPPILRVILCLFSKAGGLKGGLSTNLRCTNRNMAQCFWLYICKNTRFLSEVGRCSNGLLGRGRFFLRCWLCPTAIEPRLVVPDKLSPLDQPVTEIKGSIRAFAVLCPWVWLNHPLPWPSWIAMCTCCFSVSVSWKTLRGFLGVNMPTSDRQVSAGPVFRSPFSSLTHFWWVKYENCH